MNNKNTKIILAGIVLILVSIYISTLEFHDGVAETYGYEIYLFIAGIIVCLIGFFKKD